MRRRIPIFVAIIQSILLLAHLFVYETCIFFFQPADPGAIRALRIATLVLAVSFVIATLSAFRFYNLLMRLFYKLAATWLGTLNFFFLASAFCWVIYFFVWGFSQIVSASFDARAVRLDLAIILFSLAVLMSLYSVINAATLRVTSITVKLPNLPESWRGRTAALITDTHLGHIRGRRFAARIVSKMQQLKPDIVFFSGDMFDGTKADLAALAEPWKDIAAPQGAYFVTGNHEEFSDPTKYVNAIAATGIRVLDNERVVADGLQILGVNYRDSTHDEHFRSVLDRIELDRSRASILLLHQPARLPISEKRGISLVLSGHTHGGQVFPSTWIATRVWGRAVHGLSRYGAMSLYTSYGAGTWGPPLRFLTYSEITVIHFE